MTVHTSAADKLRIIMVLHTHWDREWYLPYQRYRTRLVGFFDLIFEILDSDPDYKHFMLDGHTILIEDYLEVRPDRREKLEHYVREGRLAAGPWYVIPDEFLPSGEALVRNILRGHRVAKQLGSVMNVGYIPDPFGQIAHMPAIFNGFGLKRAVFWRGTDSSLKTTELIWESPDGSAVLTKHIRGGYGIGGPFPTDEDEFVDKVQFVRGLLEPYLSVPLMLMMWGSDHTPPQRELSHLVRVYNERIDDAEIVIGSLPQCFDELDPLVEAKPPVKRRGEFRSGQLANVLPGVLSARMWIKQRTFDCEQALTRWAEPLTLWSEILRARIGETWLEPPLPPGPPSPSPHEVKSDWGLLDRAWRLLLENQPHDSICGCSIDQTHDEMRPRFEQCEQVAEDLTQQAMRRIGAQGIADRVYVFNPLPGPRTDYVTTTVPAVRDKRPVALIDDKGKRHDCQVVEDTEERQLGGRPRTAIGFVARDVPAFGYRTYSVEYEPVAQSPLDKVRARKAAPKIDNGIFTVSVDPKDGSLRVEDKRTGVKYRGLNRIVDGGDRGDEYNYCATDPDPLVTAPAAPAKVRLIEDGPARQTLEISMTYRLPARVNDKRQRVAKTVACPVRVLVSLSPGVPRIDIRTEIENNAEDHRLRAHFPTGVQSDVAHAEQHFGVVTRKIALPQADKTWCEVPSGYEPQKTFVDINDGHGGMMIANRGLPEYEALPGGRASTRLSATGVTIALTLLRCVGWLSRMDYPSRHGHAGPPLSTPGAQMLGTNVAEYSIIPHVGGWEKAYDKAHQFAAPMRARFNRQGTGQLPAVASLLEVDGAGVVVTALKRSEDGDGVVARVYNTLNRASSGKLSFGERWSRAEIVDMKEDALDTKADVANNAVRLKLRPNEIVTVRFR